MAKLPKIDSEGLRLAKRLGSERVSSVLNMLTKCHCGKFHGPGILDSLTFDPGWFGTAFAIVDGTCINFDEV